MDKNNKHSDHKKPKHFANHDAQLVYFVVLGIFVLVIILKVLSDDDISDNDQLYNHYITTFQI